MHLSSPQKRFVLIFSLIKKDGFFSCIGVCLDLCSLINGYGFGVRILVGFCGLFLLISGLLLNWIDHFEPRLAVSELMVLLIMVIKRILKLEYSI